MRSVGGALRTPPPPCPTAGISAACSIAFAVAGRLVEYGVALLGRVGVLFPHLDRLVRLARDQTAARFVEGGREDATLALERAGLRDGLQRLEAVAGLPIPHVDVA